MKDYISFHNQSHWSLMDSLLSPSDLFYKAKELGQSAIALTDHGVLVGNHDALKASRETGVKLIMGCEMYFADDVNDKDSRLRHIILLAKNAAGYRNLLRLSKEGYDNYEVMFKKVIPRIDWKLLEKYSDGLICTSACGGGILGQLINTRRIPEAKIQAKRLKDIFGDSLALEIQPHAMKRVANLYKDYEDQKFTNHQLVKIGDELGIKIIATTNAHYSNKEDHLAHDVLLAAGSGQPIFSGNRLKYTNDFWMRSRDEVVAGLAFFGGRAEEFCDNTLLFGEMCETPDWIEPKFSNPSGVELPDFPVQNEPDFEEFKSWWQTKPEFADKRQDAAYLWFKIENGLKTKPVSSTPEVIKARIATEMEILEMKTLCSYMLIVADYNNWAKSQGIPTGTGRGSGAGCFAAYLIGIHEVDSIKYGLIFERFFNKIKTGLSDLDMDYSQAGKPLVEQYIINKYGAEYCAQVSNYSTLTSKPYAKTIARVFQYGGDQKAAVAIGNAIAETIPKDIKNVLSALAEAPLFAEYASSPKYSELATFAKHLGNKYTNLSVHAGAMIIGKRPLADIVPVRRTKDGNVVVEWEKERAEYNGLAKMDLLGLSTLDIIADTFALIKARGKTPPAIPWDYDLNDKKAYDLISSGKTFGVFQFGTSGGTIELCKQIKPRNIEDLAIITALTRPGVTKDARAKFIELRESGGEAQLLHPSLKRALEPTSGFAVFDECCLTLAQDVAGWDLNEADRLRKFVKEKGRYPEKDKKLQKDFVDGAIRNNIEPEMAQKIWDDVLGNFGAYLFNKAHAVAYSFLTYQTAYLKAHFPLEFLITNLTHESSSNALDKEDNVKTLKNEIRELGVKIIPPDINQSDSTYTIIDDKTVMTGFDSLKYIGKDSIPEILAKRPFTSFEDFLSRCDGKKVKAPAVQALAASGCLDGFKMSRKQMFLYASDYKKKLQVFLKKGKKDSFNYPWPEDKSDWSLPEKYAQERYYIGEGLSANKMQAYPGFFNSSSPKFSEYYSMFPDPGVSTEHYAVKPFSGEIKGFFEFKVKKEDSKSFGKHMGKITLEDPWGNVMGMTVFPKEWKEFKDRIHVLLAGKAEFEPGVAICCNGELNWYEGNLSLTFKDLLKVVPPPPRPLDLKPKKVSMRQGRVSKKVAEIDADELLEEIEDELIEDGFADLSEDDFDTEADIIDY